MIELAPNNKLGLSVTTPILLGSGAVGWGADWPEGLQPHLFGAFVTPPLSLNPRRGHPAPRLAEIPGGFILHTGDHNPGLRRALRDDAPDWPSLELPLIIALAASSPEDWTRLAERLDDQPGVAGLELHLPSGVTTREAATWVANVRRDCELPLFVKLRATQAAPLAGACAGAGADGLVVGSPPVGAAFARDGAVVEGPVAGPAAFPFSLRALRSVAVLDLPVSLIAAGGVTSPEIVRICLDAGADAVQLRSWVWTDPVGVAALVGNGR
jgi:dihydroorotate dehydrogenase (NAD+) catalytic subunit